MPPYAMLIIAVVAEVVATTALKESSGFTRTVPSVITVIGYSIAFYFLSLTLQRIPTGVTYAIWSGLGIVLITVIAWLLHGQKLDLAAFAGMGLIIAGVAVLQLFSKVSEA